MDKTISISLGGFSFIVDDRAFFKLKNYLDEIRHSLHGMEGTEDILADVEVRIAELFKERLGAREVVNEQDVDHIVGIMGRPEQYVDADNDDAQTSYQSKAKSSQSYSSANDRVKKKLYRDPDDKVIAGVLSGLAHYLGVETWVTRVIFIILMFSDMFISLTSISVISYIVLWIILPKADTASQKYEMFGQAGDFETIKKNANQAAAEMKGMAKDASSNFGRILQIILKVILVFIGVMLIVTGISMIVGTIAVFIMSATDIPMQFFGYFVDYPWQDWATKITTFILMAVPGILLILFGVRLISDRIKINKTFVIGSIVLWFIALFAGAVIVGSLFSNFTRNVEFAEKKSFTVNQDTITVAFDQYKDFNDRKMNWRFVDDMGGFLEFDGKLYREISDDIELRVSPDNQVHVEVFYYSKGKNMDDARKYADDIQYNYQMNASGQLILDKYLTLPKYSKFRDQKATIVVYLPKGKTLYTKNVDDVEVQDDLGGYINYYDGENKYFNFVNSEIQCTNCFDENDVKYGRGYESGANIQIGTGDTADINIDSNGINIQDGKDKVIINKNQIKISDGTDSLNINISGN